MDAKKLIGLHIDTQSVNLKVTTEAEAETVLRRLDNVQKMYCRRIKGTNTFTLCLAHCAPESLGESLAEYLNEK